MSLFDFLKKKETIIEPEVLTGLEETEEEFRSFHDITLRRLNEETGLPIPPEFMDRADEKITQIVFNKRPVPKGSIFYCARGHKKHMNEIDINDVKNNASFIVSEEPFFDCPTIIVERALTLMIEAMKMLRNEMPNQIIGVTGSVGKTSCKGMIASVLRQHFKSQLIAKDINNNTLSRIVSALQGIDDPSKVLLQEVAIDSPAYKGCSAQIMEADVAVFTNIRDNHIQQFKTRKKIAQAKLALADYGHEDGLAVILHDDPLLMKHEYKQPVVTYSITDPEADYYGCDILQTEEGISFTLKDKKTGESIPMKLSIVGEHNVLNALAGYAVAKHYDIPTETIKKGVWNYRTKGIRQNLLNFGKYRVLADCYNSSYEAVDFMLRSFDSISTKEGVRKIAVLGDVFMLGDLTEEIHRKMGKLVRRCKNVDMVLLVGEAMKFAYEECMEGKRKPSAKVLYFETMNDVREFLRGEIRQDDFIFMKASNGMYFGEMLDSLFGSYEGEVELIGAMDYLLADDENGNNYFTFPDHATLRIAKASETVTIPETIKDLQVRVIGASVYKDNKELKEIRLPKTVTRLHYSCFENTDIREISLPASLKQIGRRAFAECRYIKHIELPEDLLVIGAQAFKDCNKLRKVTIGSNTQLIADNAFEGCKRVKFICSKGSYAEKYANEHGFKVKYN